MSFLSFATEDPREIGRNPQRSVRQELFIGGSLLLGTISFCFTLAAIGLGHVSLAWELGTVAGVFYTLGLRAEKKLSDSERVRRTSVDADRVAKQIMSDFRSMKPNTSAYDVEQVGSSSYPNILPADILQSGEPLEPADLQVLRTRIAKEFRTQLYRQQKSSLRWQWFFFLAGVMVSAILQYLISFFHI